MSEVLDGAAHVRPSSAHCAVEHGAAAAASITVRPICWIGQCTAELEAAHLGGGHDRVCRCCRIGSDFALLHGSGQIVAVPWNGDARKSLSPTPFTLHICRPPRSRPLARRIGIHAIALCRRRCHARPRKCRHRGVGWSLGGRYTALTLATQEVSVAREQIITIRCTPRFVHDGGWPQQTARGAVPRFYCSGFPPTTPRPSVLSSQALNQPGCAT